MFQTMFKPRKMHIFIQANSAFLRSPVAGTDWRVTKEVKSANATMNVNKTLKRVRLGTFPPESFSSAMVVVKQ